VSRAADFVRGRTRGHRTALIAALVTIAVAVSGGLAAADSFMPVRLAVTIAPVARRHVPLTIKVRVSADASVLDLATAPVRLRVKLAGECGGTPSGTSGTTLLDRRLNPQPHTGKPYSVTVSGSGKPTTFGVMTVCAYLEDTGDNRMFANDTSNQVNVSRPCTAAAARYDTARRRQRPAKMLKVLRRAASRACGPGVPL
jgi:hypothetical protein